MNIIHNPEHMCLYTLPIETKDRIKDKWLSYNGWGKYQSDIEGMIKYMYSKQHTDSELKEIYTRFTILDKYRAEKTIDVVKDFYPELEQYFQNDK
jgi:ribosomal protein S12 methylthiotransferase accessory factor YcaO